MKWLIVLLLVSAAFAAGEKKLDKRPAKKAHSQKPTKAPKTILEEFTALPPADVDFIKELDRQFAEHGNKIRIKVERSNATDGKHIKRTIEGDLGYGHYSNQAEEGYHFSKPKYMIYPYSQHELQPARSTHSTAETVTDIEITPSHSYELKPIEEVYQIYPTQQYEQHHQQHYYHQQGQHQAKQLYQQEDAPVIVLKIPGPSKYAAHLQALLQQYLEIRAAQLYRELEEHEYQQQHQLQQQHQQQQQHPQQHHHYVQEEHHQPQEQHQHKHHPGTKYSQPDPVYPTEIAYVPMIRTSHNTFVPLVDQYYDGTPKVPDRPTKHPNYRKTTVTPTHIAYHSTAQPEPAYHYQTYHGEQHPHQQEPSGHPHTGHAVTQIQYQYVAQQAASGPEEDHETQYVYEKPAINFVTPVPDAHQSHPDPYHEQHQPQQPPRKYPNFSQYHHHHRPQPQQEEEYLPEPKLVENYPSHKHTRVVYKSPSLKAELQQEAAMEHQAEHEHYHHQHQHEHQQQQEAAHYEYHQPQHQQQQYILQEIYPSQASYFEDKSFVESAGPQVTTEAAETASPHYNTEPVVTITQRPKQRYNYHAHSAAGHHGGGSGGGRGSRMASITESRGSRTGSSKRGDAAPTGSGRPYTEEQFRKVNKMVQRMKKKSRTTVDPADMAMTMVTGSLTTGPTSSPSPASAA
ncbi:transcription factor mef2A [Anopheles bellator]|uniref:transcription factor mef2A n=1 Tax=Anopheles bellator TaxID=139047 RepID=UPI00264A048E|nr:transcription factor mef2A [Anopheles bellator]